MRVKTILMCGLIWLFTMSVAGCGGGGGSEDANNSTPVDTTPPAFESASPTNGATAIAIDSPIVVRFTEAVSPTSINATTFTVKDPGGTTLAGTYHVSDDKATFTPSSHLAVSTVYKATVTSGVKDLAGNALVGNSEWSFTTATAGPIESVPPTVVSVSPVNGAANVDVHTSITVTFSENVQQLAAANFIVTVGNAAVSGTLATSGLTATFTPSVVLPNNAAVSLSVFGVKDLAGNSMTNTFNSSFTTQTGSVVDTTPPFVVATTPANTATGVSTGSTVVITMSEAIQPNVGSVVLTQGGATVPAALAFNGSTLTITPTTRLTANTVYSVAISGQKDLAGNTMASALTIQFTTTSWSGPISLANSAASFFSATPGQATWNNATGVVTVNSKPTNRWDIQLRWHGIPVDAGQSYRVTFTCSGGNTVNVLFKKNVANFDEYASKQVVCDGAKTVDLIPNQTNSDARLELQFGLPQTTYPATFTLSGVTVDKI